MPNGISEFGMVRCLGYKKRRENTVHNLHMYMHLLTPFPIVHEDSSGKPRVEERSVCVIEKAGS